MRRLIEVLVLSAALCAMAKPAHADTIFSNLGLGGTVNVEAAHSVDSFTDLAMSFMVGAGSGFNLTQIDIAIRQVSSGVGSNGAVVELVTDFGGLPGSLLHSWTLTNLPAMTGPVGATGTLQASQSITGITGISLAGGTQYWLVALPIDANAFMGWNFVTPTQIGPFAYSHDSGSTWLLDTQHVPGAFDVQGTPLSTSVPEPSALALLIGGLAGCALAKKRLLA